MAGLEAKLHLAKESRSWEILCIGAESLDVKGQKKLGIFGSLPRLQANVDTPSFVIA